MVVVDAFNNHGIKEIIVYANGLYILKKSKKCFLFLLLAFTLHIRKQFREKLEPDRCLKFQKGIEKIKAHEDTRLHCISLAQWKSFQQ